MNIQEINLLRNFDHRPGRKTIFSRKGGARGTETITGAKGDLDPKCKIPASIKFNGEILGRFLEREIINEYLNQLESITYYTYKNKRALIKECKTVNELHRRLSGGE